jgi:hypothetical protein
MEGNPFYTRYRRLSNMELLKLLGNYSPLKKEARKAAEEELKNRGLELEELIELRDEMDKHQREEASRQQKLAAAMQKITAFGKLFAGNFKNSGARSVKELFLIAAILVTFLYVMILIVILAFSIY